MGIAEVLKLEQVNALYKGVTPSLLIMGVCVYTASLIVLWPVYDQLILVAWYISGIAFTVFRRLSAINFERANVTVNDYQPWISKAIIWAFLSGVSWGLIFIFFSSPDHFFRLLALLGIYTILIALSCSKFAVYVPVYLAFSAPSTILFVGKLFFIGGDVFYISGILVIAYFIEITSIALNTQRAFNKTEELRFFNNKLLKEVTTQKEAAEEAAETKNQFLAAASHDLRQPLHAQGLFISSLKELKLPPETDEIVSKVHLSTEALNGLLNSLLDISRLEADSVEYNPANLELRPIIKDIVSQYSERATEKNIEFEVQLKGDLVVNSDIALLSRLIRNVIDNAVKYTDSGEISIHTKANNEKVFLTVDDTGCGIPDSEKENIFTEFTQLGNQERDRQKGLGLGLAIVKRLAALMDIQITMESTIDVGSSFTIAIPIMDPTSHKISQVNIKENLLQTFIGETILVIDDEEDILDGMRHVINSWGANVVTADNWKVAIKKLEASHLKPSLILADFRLRYNKNGIDAINAIRKYFNTQISAILITGDTAPDRLQLARSAEATVLHKPVNPSLLRDTTHKVLSKSKDSV